MNVFRVCLKPFFSPVFQNLIVSAKSENDIMSHFENTHYIDDIYSISEYNNIDLVLR